MAENVAMRAMLMRLGFTATAATVVVDEQGMDSCKELCYLTDDKVEGLCQVVQKPGGTIPNPNAAVAGQPAVISNPGTVILKRAENNLKLACHFICHYAHISHAVVVAMITLNGVRAMHPLKQQEEDHEDPEPPENLINAKDWPKTFEGLLEYFRTCLGATKIPLVYVIRDNIEVPAEADDPATNYLMPQDKMIARAPIQDAAGIFMAHYITDQETVWEKLVSLTRDHTCWTYVKPAQHARDGRAGYQALYERFLGPNNTNNLAASAESKLKKATYFGEKKHWNFEKYVNLQKEQHNILEGLTQYGYAGIDDGSKV
jgi:hypothetical protein